MLGASSTFSVRPGRGNNPLRRPPRNDAERDGEPRRLVGGLEGKPGDVGESAVGDEHDPRSDYVGAVAQSHAARD